MDIDLKLLQYAVVLARYRHFGRAASALGVSQPTLSRNIAALEKQIGLRVFERSRTDIAATAAGSDVLKMAEELVGRATAISNRLDMVREGKGGHLRVAAGTFMCDIAVYPALVDLLNDGTPVSIEVLEREWTGTLATIMDDQVDFAVMDVDSLHKSSDLRVDVIQEVQFHFICAANHPLAGREAIQPADLAGYRLVYMRQPVDWRFDADDLGTFIDPLSGSLLPPISLSSCRAMFDIVARSDGITVAHPSQIEEELNSGRLAILPYNPGKRLCRAFGFVYNRHRTPQPAARTFMSLVRKHLKAATS